MLSRHKKHSVDVINDIKIHERHYVKEAIEKTCKKVLEEKFHWEMVINEVEKYLDTITENKVTDLQSKILTLNFHEKKNYFMQNIFHKLFTDVKHI